jgi:predicted AlkP superfamily phosphohydrolase/phosphomutase
MSTPSTTSSPLVVIGFDAMDAGIARHLAAEGRMPALAGLLARGAWRTVTNPPGLVVGSTWPSFWTGLWPSRHGFYCYQQVEPHSYKVRRYNPNDITGRPFWLALDEAGRRTCIIDVPLVPLTQPRHGLHVIDWGTHDRMLEHATHPEGLADEIHAEIGTYPLVDRCDLYAERGDWDGLHATLLAGIERKTALHLKLLARGGWDMFAGVYAESHCAGHQFWWAHDPRHPRYRAEAGDPLLKVYEALDRALARMLEALPTDATLCVLLSHGIGSHHDADHLLRDILFAFDDALGRASPAIVWRERIVRRVLHWRERRRNPELAKAGRAARWVDASRRFVRIPNNELYGGVRLNIAGREPRGRVKPEDVEAVSAWLERELLALREPDTGRRIVRRVLRASALYTGDLVDGLPDLLIDWDRTAPITAVASPTIGEIRGDPQGTRTGDHRPTGLLVATGPGVTAGAIREEVRMVDLAPTFAALQGVTLTDVDGTPLPALVESRAGAA